MVECLERATRGVARSRDTHSSVREFITFRGGACTTDDVVRPEVEQKVVGIPSVMSNVKVC